MLGVTQNRRCRVRLSGDSRNLLAVVSRRHASPPVGDVLSGEGATRTPRESSPWRCTPRPRPPTDPQTCGLQATAAGGGRHYPSLRGGAAAEAISGDRKRGGGSRAALRRPCGSARNDNTGKTSSVTAGTPGETPEAAPYRPGAQRVARSRARRESLNGGRSVEPTRTTRPEMRRRLWDIPHDAGHHAPPMV